jgi:hypothetical protein
MFNTTIKKFQQYNSSQTWRQSLRNRVITKNNYRANGNIKKAKAFVHLFSEYSFSPAAITSAEQIIFPADVPLAYI